MPVFRNVNPNRQSGRLGNQTPVIYDGDGWPTLESIYLPNGGMLDGSVSQRPTSPASSLSSLTVPQIDRSHPHYRQQERRPCVPSDQKLDTSRHPSPRESHGRRREPGHIPRPRNAFIFFRSSYVSGHKSAGEGQQNELSKQAGKVWNKMTEEEKRPFFACANDEKKWHQTTYPNYTYCPGTGAGRRKGRTVIKNTKSTSRPKKTSSTSSSACASDKSTFPKTPFTARAKRPPRAAALRAVEKFLHPHSASPSPCSASPTPKVSSMLESLELAYPEPDTPPGEDAFVPTPAEELTAAKKEEPEPQFDLTIRPPHLDRIPEQFGFKRDSDCAAMLACFPPMPDTNDDMVYTEDVPSLFSQLSGLPADSPPMCNTDDDPLDVSWSTHYFDTPRMHVPGFAWSYHENLHYDHMQSEDSDMTFLGSIFDLDVPW